MIALLKKNRALLILILTAILLIVLVYWISERLLYQLDETMGINDKLN